MKITFDDPAAWGWHRDEPAVAVLMDGRPGELHGPCLAGFLRDSEGMGWWDADETLCGAIPGIAQVTGPRDQMKRVAEALLLLPPF